VTVLPPPGDPPYQVIYYVTVTDNCGNTDIAQVYVNIVECDSCDTPPVTFNITPPLCFGDPAVVTYTGPGLGTDFYTELVDPQYSWDIAPGTLVSGTLSGSGVPGTLEVLYSSAGTYDITLHVTNYDDGDPCPGSDTTFSVTIPEELVTSITGTDISCYQGADGTIDLSVSNGTAPYYYAWSTGATTEDITGVPAGEHYVTVTDANGCTSVISITLNEPTELISTISGENISCYQGSDGTIDLEPSQATPPYTYIWSTGATTQDLADLPEGTYYVTITDNNGCTATNSITLTQPTELTSSITGIDVSCFGYSDGSVDVTAYEATPPYTYLWSNGSVTEDLNNVPAGDYYVTITDNNGCTTTNSFTINEPPEIIIDQPVVVDVTCYGDNDGSITVSSSGGTGSHNYSIPGNTNQNGYFSGLSAGDYTITVTDQNGCTNTIAATIIEPPELVLSLNGNSICIGEITALTVYASGGTPDYTYAWNTGPVDQSIIVNPTVTSSYSVLVTDDHGCTASASATVYVYPPLAITVYPDDTICEGDNATIYASYYGGMGEPYTLTLNGSMTIQTPYSVSPSVTTVYEVCVNDNCTTPQECDNLEIVVMPDPPVNFVADIYNGCEPLIVNFSEISQHEGQTYQWNFGDPWGSTTGNGKNPVHTFENAGIYDVTCTVTSEYGCTSSWTWYEMIWVWPNPVAAFYPYPQVATILDPYIYFENNSSTYYITNWTFGDGDSSNVIHPQHKYDGPGTYNVMLAVETEHGCVDTTWSDVVIQDIITFYAPTAFSPDFDEMNGLFCPIGHGIDPDYWHLMIYDRWGEKIWETHVYDVDEETGEVYHGWDGTVRDKKMGETAVYGWLVIYRDVTGAEHQQSGLVTLIR